MRRTWIGLFVLGVVVAMPAGAEDAAPKSGAPPGRAKSAVTTVPPTPRGASAVEIELERLRELIQEQSKELEAQRAVLREQQKRLEALAEELRGLRANRDTPAATPSARSSLAAVAQSQEGFEETKKSAENSIKRFGPFRFSGDLRLRSDSFFGGGALTGSAPTSRHREQFRLRFSADAKFSDEFSGGFSIASGETGNPVAANQSLTNFFLRKPISIDKAFVTYTPRWFKPFQVTAGRWGYTWYRTELTWDNDLNPEGVSEALHFNWKDSLLEHLGIVAFQMPLLEVSAGADSAVFGGQLQTNWKLHKRVRFGAYAAYYDYRKPDSLAANQVGSGPGTPTGVLAGNNNTNSFGVIDGRRIFASKFGVVNVIARLDVDTSLHRFPLLLQFDFAQNTQACANRGAFTAAGLTPPFCNPRARHAYWSEIQFGRTEEKDDLRLGYTFVRIEREAIVSAFNFSDLPAATNVANHRLEIFYQAYRNITLGLTGLIGRQLVTSTSAPERWLKRLQLDLLYKF